MIINIISSISISVSIIFVLISPVPLCTIYLMHTHTPCTGYFFLEMNLLYNHGSINLLRFLVPFCHFCCLYSAFMLICFSSCPRTEDHKFSYISSRDWLFLARDTAFLLFSYHGFLCVRTLYKGILCVRTRDTLNLFLEWGNLLKKRPHRNRKLVNVCLT